MTAVEKVKVAEQQIIAVANGRLDRIDCPFCGTISTRQHFLLCCDTMAEMTEAVLDRIETGENIAMAAEAVGRARQLADRQRQSMIVLN